MSSDLTIKERIENFTDSVSSSVKKKFASINEDMYVPGILGVVQAPLEAVACFFAYLKACTVKDKEAQYDNLLRLSVLPLGFIYSLGALFKTAVFVNFFFNLKILAQSRALTYLVGTVTAFGVVLSALEMVIEVAKLWKDFSFFKQFHAFRKDDRAVLADIATIHNNYLSLQAEEYNTIYNVAHKRYKESASDFVEKLEQDWLQKKENDLANRIRPWAVAELKKAFREDAFKIRLTQAEPDRETIQKARALHRMIQTQCHKKFLMRTLGMIAIALEIAAFAIALFTVPYLIPLVLLGGFAVAYMARYLVAHGMLDQPGWRFSASDCVPEPVKKVYRKIIPPAMAALGRLGGYLKERVSLGAKALQEKGRRCKRAIQHLF